MLVRVHAGSAQYLRRQLGQIKLAAAGHACVVYLQVCGGSTGRQGLTYVPGRSPSPRPAQTPSALPQLPPAQLRLQARPLPALESRAVYLHVMQGLMVPTEMLTDKCPAH